MKHNSDGRSRAWIFVLAGVMAASCVGDPATMTPRPEGMAVIGRFVIEHQDGEPAYFIQFNKDGTFESDLNGDGEVETSGTFTMRRNRLSILNTNSIVCKGLRGVYDCTREGGKLTFVEVGDECGVRKSLFRKHWILQ